MDDVKGELSDALYAQVKELCAEGDAAAEDGDYGDALDEYWAALGLLPEPKTRWEAATWILAAIGDAQYLSGDYAGGRDNLELAMLCPGADANAFIHLRLGECRFELSELDGAADELGRAFKLAGDEIFEDEDAQYLAFLMSRLETPPGGW